MTQANAGPKKDPTDVLLVAMRPMLEMLVAVLESEEHAEDERWCNLYNSAHTLLDPDWSPR